MHALRWTARWCSVRHVWAGCHFPVSNDRVAPSEGALSIATLAVAIWVTRFLLPRAVREDNALALTSALISLAIAVLLWFLTGFVRVFS